MASPSCGDLYAVHSRTRLSGQGELYEVFSFQCCTQRNASQDGEWITYMAEAPSATAGPDPFAVVLELPKALMPFGKFVGLDTDIMHIKETFTQEIRHHLSNNRAVVVQEWYPEMRCGFSVDEIGMVLPSTTNTVRWQGQKYSTLSEIYVGTYTISQMLRNEPKNLIAPRRISSTPLNAIVSWI